jgi:flagellar hook-associated protein FlgK
MANQEQIIVEDSITIDGDITVEGLTESLEIDQQIADNTQLLNSMLKQLKEINKTLKKIYR